MPSTSCSIPADAIGGLLHYWAAEGFFFVFSGADAHEKELICLLTLCSLPSSLFLFVGTAAMSFVLSLLALGGVMAAPAKRASLEAPLREIPKPAPLPPSPVGSYV